MKTTTKITSILILALITACGNQKAASPEPTSQNRQGDGPPNIEEIFKMDVNRDGKLSKLEVTGPLLKDFDKFDLNKDGFITKEELGEEPKPKGERPERGNGERPPRR